MRRPKHYRLINTEWPQFGIADPPARLSAEEFEKRINAVRSQMELRGLTHLIIYGDREHFANLTYLTGFDPRFEEALLIISQTEKPILLVGNECEGYLTVSPLYTAGNLREERFQPFSLLNQPRDKSRFIREIFIDEGIGTSSKVGCVGWKYFSDSEIQDSRHALEIPSYLADSLREIAGRDNVINATEILMHPDYGLRTFCSPSEIAYFEYTSILASEGVKRMILGMREGMTDHDLAKLVEFNGVPLGTHMTLITGANREYGLSGPIGAVIQKGDPFASNVSYWGSNTCRAGWIASSAGDLPDEAKDYVEQFAGKYFEVMAEWFTKLKIGTRGDEITRLIAEKLPYKEFGIFLNPGHLIHLDEWLSSPIYPGSEIPIHSGMALQVDVIPSSPQYFSTRMEDGVVIADKELRFQLKVQFPECYNRCQKRRSFMQNILGIQLPVEVLPLSNIPSIVPPFFLDPNTIFAIEH
jgi:Xaa-Pro aminopeptidase